MLQKAGLGLFALNFGQPLSFVGSLSLCSHKLEEEFEWLKKSEVLYYSVEKKGSVSSQLKHSNPWSLKCQQQQLQRMKDSAKHRSQHSILYPRDTRLGSTGGK